MKILVINPNSSPKVTKAMEKEARKHATDAFEIQVQDCPDAPPAIVTARDELHAGLQVIKLLTKVKKGSKNLNWKVDGAVIGCFADPGLWAAREIASFPVVGLFESSIYFAKLCGTRYSIIASGGSGDISAWHSTLRAVDETSHVASIRYLDSTVEAAVEAENDRLHDLIQKCRREDGADAVILGCSAFAGRGRILSRQSEIPVIDGIEESIRLAAMLAEYRNESRC